MFRGREAVRNFNKKNTFSPNRYFYCEGPHFMSIEYYTSFKDDVVNQYMYIDNNLMFFEPRVLNIQRVPRRLGMILKESVIGELRLRG